MVDKRFVCKYPQYSFCGAFDCQLSKYCSLYPIYYLKSYERGYHNPIKKTPEERKQHNQNYILYNTLFSNYKEKNKVIQRRWYENNRKKENNNCIIKKCFSVMCNLDCFNCEYEDCIINDEDYHKMYYQYNHDKLLKQKASYRTAHRQELSEKSKKYYYENIDACKARNKKYREKHKKELKDYFHHRTQLYSYKMSRRKDISVCTYPQYECCGYKKCNLYHICSQLKITNKTTDEIILEKNGHLSERKEVILL